MGQPCIVTYPERNWLGEYSPEKVVLGCTYSHGRVRAGNGEVLMLVQDGPDQLRRPISRAMINDFAAHIGGRRVVIAPV